MATETEYKKAHERYRQAAAAHTKGVGTDGKPLEGRSEKARIMGDIVQMEQDAAKDGVILNAMYKGDQVVVQTGHASSKRSVQEEYVRKFDGETKVELNNAGNPEPKLQTLREYHAKRLGVRA